MTVDDDSDIKKKKTSREFFFFRFRRSFHGLKKIKNFPLNFFCFPTTTHTHVVGIYYHLKNLYLWKSTKKKELQSYSRLLLLEKKNISCVIFFFYFCLLSFNLFTYTWPRNVKFEIHAIWKKKRGNEWAERGGWEIVKIKN